MREYEIKGRFTHKHDTEANWRKAINFTPKQGEIIIYDVDENYDHPRIKTGNGVDHVNDLPFSNTVEGATLDGYKLAIDDNKNIVIPAPSFILDDDGVLSVISVSSTSS